MYKISVVDDEPEITELIKAALSDSEYRVYTFNRPEELIAGNIENTDLFIMDVMMPGIDGFTLCSMLRDETDAPIIFLTAKTEEKDLLKGIGIGGDDYIKKPFSLAELRARVEMHLRREERKHTSFIRVGNFRFNLLEKTMYKDNEIVNLTKTEYMICEFLAENRGRVYSLEQIYDAVFEYDSDSEIVAVREHIKNIRSKLKKCNESPIETVWGIGYKWK